MSFEMDVYRRRWSLAALVLLGGMVGLMLQRNLAAAFPRAAGGEAAASPAITPVFPETEPIEARYWHALHPMEDGSAVASVLTERYELAGTFLSYSGSGNDAPATRIAVLDDLKEKKQVLVYEGRMVEGHKVVMVDENRAVLEGPRGRVELWRRVSAGAVPKVASPDPNLIEDENADGSFYDAPALETNRFGKRVAADRWILERKALMGYYEEMMANPERLVMLYKSFRPDRKDGEVAGFQFKTEGEADFFKAVGFQDGDVVRAVNSMQMTSQRRAEFFIGEFARENLNAVVIEVERGGETRNLIYLMR